MPDKSVDFLIHSSFSNISLVVLIVVLLFGERWIMSRWVGTIWNESIGTPLKCVEWWESVPDETVDLFVHSSLGDVLLVVLSLVEAVASVHVFVVAGSLERRWVRSVGNEWEVASHSGVEWWQVTSNESMDLLIHTSLCNIFIVVLVMVMFLVLSKRVPSENTIISPWLRFSFLTIDSRDNATCKIVNFRIIAALIHILELGLLLMLNKRLWGLSSFATIKGWSIRRMFNLVNWGGDRSGEAVNFCVHLSLSNIWVLSVVMFPLMEAITSIVAVVARSLEG